MTLHPNQLKGAPGYRRYTSIPAAIKAARVRYQSTGRHYGIVQTADGEMAVRVHRPDSTFRFMWSTRTCTDDTRHAVNECLNYSSVRLSFTTTGVYLVAPNVEMFKLADQEGDREQWTNDVMDLFLTCSIKGTNYV